ncbi:SCP2 sterol-binding domain-containing protein [Rhodococcus koreensis]|uniref:SCP2 sterol-binding domain-containing protein n=1 Tax=Rhodococcus koreensis TaxID=99653 RepID=UPI0036D94705
MSKSLRSATDPGAVLSDRFPRDLTDVALTHSDARIVLDIAGHGRWTITVDDGMAEVTRDVATDPTCTVHTDADTLADLLIGRRSGVDAFLGGDLTTREPCDRPPDRRRVRPGRRPRHPAAGA